MTAVVLDIHDFMPVHLDPPKHRDEPACVIILPTVPILRVRDHYVAKWRSDVKDDGLPSDSQ